MNRSIYYWLLAAGVALLQIYFFASNRPFGIVPNLVLVMVVLAGAFQTATYTVVTALTGGLLLDLASGGQFGLKLAFFLILALALVLARQNGLELQKFSVLIPVLLVATLLYNLSLISVVVLAHGLISWQVVMGRIVLEAALNLLILVVLKPVVEWMSPNRLEVAGG